MSPRRSPSMVAVAIASLSMPSVATGQHPIADAAAVTPASATPAAPAVVSSLMIVAGGSTVVETDFPIKRFALTNPAVADAIVVEPRQLLVDGKSAGSVSLIVWGESRLASYEVVVYPPTPTLQRQLKALFPNEDIGVSLADEAIVLSGKASSNAVALRAVEIAEKSSAKSKVVNLLQLPGGNENQQVMLQVRVAEVNQRALFEVGSTLFTGPNGYKNWVGRVTTEQFSAPNFTQRIGPPPVTNPTDEGKFSFSDFLNLFVLNTKYDIGLLIKALKTRGYFQSLAEPTLIAYNGQEASFLAGGEIPVPIAQGITGAVSVTYKEFGVRLTFKPTIAGDVIRMKVKPEVSSIDFSTGVTLQGFRIPGLITRRAETDVELRDGQSFAIGGLLNNLSQTDRSAIPILSNLPIIGNFFKSKAESKERTELVVLITPHLVHPLDANQVPPLPTRSEQFLQPGGGHRPAGSREDGEDSKEGQDGQGGRAGRDSANGASTTNAANPAPLPATPAKLCLLFWCR